MSIPVLRLSQALYSDAPSPVPAQMTPPSSSASRKRCHSRVAGPPFVRRNTKGADASATATTVRVMLPRTFATADRAYHATGDATPIGAAREEEGGVAGYALCRGVRAADGTPKAAGGGQEDDAVSVSCDDGAVDGEVSTAMDCSHRDSNSRSTACSPTSSAALNKGGSQRRCYGRSRAVTAGGDDAVPAVATTLVVESVLGFSAVRDLLERSHGLVVAGLGGDDEPAEKQPCCSAGAEVTLIGKGHGGCGEVGEGGVVELGVSEAVGRLVGWLRLAAASESLVQQEQQHRSVNGSGSGGRVTDNVGQDDGPARRGGDGEGESLPSRARENVVLGGEDGAMAAPADSAGVVVVEAGTGCAGYEVTGRYEAGSEWSVFDLELTKGA